jgi:LPXTG-site transpeptidase (sortase) family protein
MTRRRLTRREFLARLSGNGMLAAGGTLVGAAAAYGVYKNRAEANLAQLKRGSLLTSAAATGAPVAPAGSESTAQTTATSAPASAASPAGSASAAPTAIPIASAVPADLKPLKVTIQTINLVDAPIVPTGTKVDKGELVWDVADHAVGYLLGTGLPGQPGNLVLSGHISAPVSGQGNIFHNLPALANKLGARVGVLAANNTWYYYSVTGTDVVLPTENWVLNPTAAPTITLLTCYPDGVYDHRFVAQGTYLGSS